MKERRKKCNVFRCIYCLKHSFFLVLIGISVVTLTIWGRGNGNDSKNIRSVHSPQDLSLQKENWPVIINWNEGGRSMESDIKCNSVRCHVTGDHEARHHHDVLAIIFSGTQFGRGGLPLPRQPGHLWSVLHEESPKNNDYLFCAKDAMEMFNLTGTFKRESHYPFPTMWLKNERDLTSTEFMMSIQKKNQLRRKGFAPIVYIQSDCNPGSDRDHYMRLLQKYIEIDSYGTCEHNKDFPTEDLTFKSGMAPMLSSDFYTLIAQYKFTLSFENTICDDYITEKFWRPLHLGVVPVVFSSPRIKDFAPSNHSIIDIRDFHSVQQVAEYITFLDTHDKEYSKYQEFKRTGTTNPELISQLNKRDWGHGRKYDSIFSGFECFVCEKLNSLKRQMTSVGPVRRWKGKHDHYGCPAPKLFDEEGRYVIEMGEQRESYEYSQYYLQSLRYHINSNIDADFNDIHQFARNLQRNNVVIKLPENQDL